ncbi:hypothetical protein [Flavobacterium praedii]|uniref:hypothetical protein n=1 Tax=Flavobacterium praedii TaxID=3002900 RepID=UPI002481BDC5|nr:hypothetical protein [Flavobacterium praedii]
MINDQNQLKGWAFTFFREEEDWFAIILNSNIHGNGFGTLLLNELKISKSNLNGWVVDHQNDKKQNKDTYFSPLNFYIKNGFKVNQNIRLENNYISAVKISWIRE